MMPHMCRIIPFRKQTLNWWTILKSLVCQKHQVVLYGKQTQASKHSTVHNESHQVGDGYVNWCCTVPDSKGICQKALEHFMTINKHLRISSLWLFQSSYELNQCKNMPSERNSGGFVCISEIMTANEKVQGVVCCLAYFTLITEKDFPSFHWSCNLLKCQRQNPWFSMVADAGLHYYIH